MSNEFDLDHDFDFDDDFSDAPRETHLSEYWTVVVKRWRIIAVCVVAVAGADGEVRTFRGEVRGTVAESPRGEDGFGYDPVFVPGWSVVTYAEMGEGKNKDSHRARAFRAVKQWLEKA